MSDRDGFIFRDIETAEERHFMPCALEGSMRERSLSGVLRQCRDDWYVVDTRDDPA